MPTMNTHTEQTSIDDNKFYFQWHITDRCKGKGDRQLMIDSLSLDLSLIALLGIAFAKG